MGNSPTMNDVAREAGVALRTVSRYVNGATNIDSELAERIRLAIDSLGYRRNLAAASIRPGWDSKVLGLIIGDLSNPYYTALTRAIEREASDRGYLLITASSEEDGIRHDKLVDRLVEQRVDGLIIVPPRNPSREWQDSADSLPPTVFLERPNSGAATNSGDWGNEEEDVDQDPELMGTLAARCLIDRLQGLLTPTPDNQVASNG